MSPRRCSIGRPAIECAAISFALVGYVYFVRSRLFPDFSFPSTKKVDGQYVFVEETP
jgi:hypothetical protein